MPRRTDVLVVGAGPTGLTLALGAVDHGARVRVIDRRGGPLRPSRALILHARTLEVLRPMRVCDSLLARADTAPAVDLHLGNRVVATRLGEMPWSDTAFPHLTLVRQTDAETVLAAALADRGVVVEWGTELEYLSAEPGGVHAALRSSARREEVHPAAIAGCDGVGSTVRAQAGIGWPGGRYDREVLLADVRLDSALRPGVAHVAAGRPGLVFLFALGERAPWRLLATRRAAAPASTQACRAEPEVSAAEVQRLLDGARLDASVTDVAWAATFALQHRLADRFRSDRLFLAGDAAHAWSPAGGQGMNAGIQDAANLAWKLALAPTSTDPDALLDSYGEERRRADAELLGLTHLLFWAESATSPLPAFLRGQLAPLMAPALPAVLRWRRLVAAGVRSLARLDADYRHGRLATDSHPLRRAGPRAGDRLPDRRVTCAGRQLRLHEVLAEPGVHVLLDRDARPLRRAVGLESGIVRVHRLTSERGAGVIAVRPDGHVGFTSGAVDDEALGDWLGRVGAGGRPRP